MAEASVAGEQRVQLPSVEYSEGVLSPDYPYNITIDQQGVADLLLMQGVREEDLARVKIKVQGQASSVDKESALGLDMLGKYNNITNNLTLYTDPILKTMRKETDKKLKQIDKNRNDGNEEVQVENGVMNESETEDLTNTFPFFVSSKRLDLYLTIAPRERARKIVERLAQLATERQINSVLDHETSHASDNLTKKHRMSDAKTILKDTLKVGAVSVGLTQGIILLLNHANIIEGDSPRFIISAILASGGTLSLNILDYGTKTGEKRAFEFEKKHRGQYKIISFSPKIPNSINQSA